ncbi:uncharacterized protein TNCV_2631311 [Trichonephila clavipes]|nr:uncharacterized protein TNCV_2631311 [Trichonephila clavipes]
MSAISHGPQYDVKRRQGGRFRTKFTCRNCGGGDRGRVAIYRPFGEVSLSLNRTVTCMVLKANDRRTSCPCHDEFLGPRSDYVRQVALATTTNNITNFIGCLCYYCDIKTEKTICCYSKVYSIKHIHHLLKEAKVR